VVTYDSISHGDHSLENSAKIYAMFLSAVSTMLSRGREPAKSFSFLAQVDLFENLLKNATISRSRNNESVGLELTTR